MSWHIANALRALGELLENVRKVLDACPEEQREQSKSLLQAAEANHAALSELYSKGASEEADDVRYDP